MMTDFCCTKINRRQIIARNHESNGVRRVDIHELLMQLQHRLLAAGNERSHNAGMQLPRDTEDEIAIAGMKMAEASGLRKAGRIRTQAERAEAETAWQEFEFPGVLANVAECRDKMMEFVAEHCPDEGDQIDILVALQEALANAALHGCKDDPAKMIRCTVSAGESDIVISIRDPGPGFDFALADPENYQVTTLTHGRGICLMRSLMSEVTFAHHGSEIVLRKQLHHP